MKKTKPKQKRQKEARQKPEEEVAAREGEHSDTSVPESPAASGAESAVASEIDPIEALRAKIETLEDALLRSKADYQNFQRRSAVERAEAVRYANADIMKSVLVVLDDFERSLEAAKSSDNLEAVVEGVRLVYDNLLQALRAHGLESIDAMHQPFDPNVHEALLQQPVADHSPGTVVEQVAKGYRLRDRVLRPAKVIVAKAMDAAAESAGEEKTELGD